MHQKEKCKEHMDPNSKKTAEVTNYSKETAEVTSYRASIQQADSKAFSPVFLISKPQNLHETKQM